MFNLPPFTRTEEILNAITHFLGIIVGATQLVGVEQKKKTQNFKLTIAEYIFSISMIFLYINSTVYHGLQPSQLKVVWRYIDHCSVFILIAGSYAPICMGPLHGALGNLILTFIWLFAIAGIICKVVFFDSLVNLSLVFYIGMGWCLVFAMKPLFNRSSKNFTKYILLGGSSYTIGCIFYYFDEVIPYFHTIFHIFILGGSIFHSYGIINYANDKNEYIILS